MRHINIPIFIPHLGCPNQCIFCNQRYISGTVSFDESCVDKTIEAVLSKDLMRGVGFYLTKYGYIGLNYRNRLAHLSGITIDEISNTLPYTFFYLYMCIVNGLLIHYCGDVAIPISVDN